MSTLQVTDPQLIEIFDTFAFDEVLQYGSLDTPTRLMLQLAVRSRIDVRTRELLAFARLVSLGSCDPRPNLRVGNDRARLIDAATPLLPFIGYPRMLNALRAIDEAVPA